MRQCWPDGDLRAYVDGELPAESQERIAGHLEMCPSCSARFGEISRRAARVSNLMAMLSESSATAAPPRIHRRQWALAALSLAAALAIAFVMLPKRATVPPPVTVAVAPPPPVQTAPAVAHPVVHRTVPRRPPPGEEFLRLDDDPIETATVVRVSAEDGALQADLIIGPDGRAHAIRVVRNQ